MRHDGGAVPAATARTVTAAAGAAASRAHPAGRRGSVPLGEGVVRLLAAVAVFAAVLAAAAAAAAAAHSAAAAAACAVHAAAAAGATPTREREARIGRRGHVVALLCFPLSFLRAHPASGLPRGGRSPRHGSPSGWGG